MSTQAYWTFLRLVNRCLTNARKPKITDVRDPNNPTFAMDVIEIVKEEYAEICSLQDWPWLREEGHITAVRERTFTGTITNGATGLNTIAGGSWSASYKGRKIKFDEYEEIYTLSNATATSGVLDRPYLGTGGAGTSFTLFQDEYSLADNFDRFIRVNKYFSNGLIELVGMSEYNQRKYESRSYVTLQGSYQPRYATLVEPKKIAIWPWPKEDQTYPYSYIQSPPELYANDDVFLIPHTDITALIHKVMIQVFGFLDSDDKAGLAFSLWQNKYAEMSGSKTEVEDVKILKAYNRDRAAHRRSRRGARGSYDYGDTFDRT